jgi:hypothetical protein
VGKIGKRRGKIKGEKRRADLKIGHYKCGGPTR